MQNLSFFQSIIYDWLNVQFHPQGYNKQGCDCLGLMIGIARELNVYFPDRPKYYDCYNDSYLLLRLDKYFFTTQEYIIGNIILFKFPKNQFHLALISNIVDNTIFIIHSCAAAKKVITHRLSNVWEKYIHAQYKFYDININKNFILH